MEKTMIPVEQIKKRLDEYFKSSQITVKDLTGSGDYIDISIISIEFKGKTTIEQHQMVYKALGSWVGKDIHAVVIHTFCPK